MGAASLWTSQTHPCRLANAIAASRFGNVSRMCASGSVLPVQPITGSINGADWGSNSRIQRRVLARPDVIADLNRVQFGKRSPVSLASGTISWPAVPFEEAFPTGNAQGYGSQTGRGLAGR